MDIQNITILGSGIMGHGIAQISATAGYNVILRDVDQAFLDKAMEKIKWSLNKLVEKNKITYDNSIDILNRITPKVDLKESLKDADMVIEAVPEDMNVKKNVYTEVDRYAPSSTIYASNTSTLPITEIGELTSRPEKFIGIHFFNPPQLMKLVEIIPGKNTIEEVKQTAFDFVKKVGKDAILCNKDVAGFIVNRIFIPLVHEAAYCLDREKVNKVTLDSAVKYKLKFPMGIFELADYTGIDVVYKATYEMHSRDTKVINPHPLIEELYKTKKFGQKTGEGFYKYGKDNYERINLTKEEANNYEPLSLISLIANNSAWLLRNNVCTKSDLQKALHLGMGIENIFDIFNHFTVEKIEKNLALNNTRYGEFYIPDPYIRNLV